MVALRLSIGVHFLYEGVWKIGNPDFSAEGFLASAKGPVAPLFYAMLPDIDGRSRLKIEAMPVAEPLRDAWRRHRDENETRIARELTRDETEENAQRLDAFRAGSFRLLWESEDQLDAFFRREREAMAALLGDEAEVEDPETAREKLTDWVTKLGELEAEFESEMADLKIAAVGGGPPPYNRVVPAAEKFDADAALAAGRVTGSGDRVVLAVEDRVTGVQQYVDRWKDLQRAVVRKYAPTDEQKLELEQLVRRYEQSAEEFVADSQPDIDAYFGSLARWEARKYGPNNGARHQRQRLWDEMFQLRAEARGWLGELNTMEEGLQNAMWDVLDDEQKQRGYLPIAWTISDLLDFSVTWGLTAIGVCLILGLFTRPAAIGGAVFLVFVLLTQPPWPTIYPPAPEVVGHALVVDKNFVEMVALLVLASTAVGRWGGLDYFVENYVLRLYERFAKKDQTDDKHIEQANA